MLDILTSHGTYGVMGPVTTQLNTTRYFSLKSYDKEDGMEVTTLVAPSYILSHTILAPDQNNMII